MTNEEAIEGKTHVPSFKWMLNKPSYKKDVEKKDALLEF